LRRWLLDRGSLTARLKAVCPDFRVCVISQGRVRGRLDEAPLLGDRRTPLIGRDVLLMDADVPLVFAHSVLRAADLREPWRAIARLGNRPLGAALFADPRVERQPLRFRQLHPGHPLYSAATAATRRDLPPLWARRSAFCLKDSPLLVTEAFLPGLAHYWHSNRSR
jgi:chorismate--pyruvate lyase